jgi:hypothetical protein
MNNYSTKKVIDVLLNANAVKDVMANRIFPVVARQGTKLPFAVVRTTEIANEYGKLSTPIGRTASVTVTIVSESYTEAAKTAEAADEAIVSEVQNCKAMTWSEDFEDPDHYLISTTYTIEL